MRRVCLCLIYSSYPGSAEAKRQRVVDVDGVERGPALRHSRVRCKAEDWGAAHGSARSFESPIILELRFTQETLA